MLLGRSCTQHGWLVCNLGSGHAVDGASVVASLERLLGRNFRLRHDAARMHANSDINLLSDPARALTMLGWEAATPLDVGLASALLRPLAYTHADELPLEAPVNA